MPPGCVHSVVTLRDSVTRGGHFLSPRTLDRTVTTNRMLNTFKLDEQPTNASHTEVFRMLVARRALCEMLPWEREVRRFVETGECHPCSPGDSDHPTIDDDIACVVDWLALLFLLKDVAAVKYDMAQDRLSSADHQLDMVMQKAHIFVEYWTRCSSSHEFQDAIESKMSELMGFEVDKDNCQTYPEFWFVPEGEQWP